MGNINRRLTASQEKFCEEYVKSYDAQQSYKTAYPNASEKSLKVVPYQLFKDPKIKNRIKELRDQMSEVMCIDQARVIEEIGKIAFDDTIGKADKLKALGLLTKCLGMEVTNQNLNLNGGPEGFTINITGVGDK